MGQVARRGQQVPGPGAARRGFLFPRGKPDRAARRAGRSEPARAPAPAPSAPTCRAIHPGGAATGLAFAMLLGACSGPRRVDVTQVDGVQVEAIESPAAIGPARTPGLKMTPAGSRRCRQVRPRILAAARREGVDPLTMLAIAWVESGFNADARSGAGAVGLMQLLPHVSAAFGCEEPEQPACAASAAARLYGKLLRRFDGAELYALCAYNAGAARVRRAWSRGVPPFNKRYADKVRVARQWLRRRGCAAD